GSSTARLGPAGTPRLTAAAKAARRGAIATRLMTGSLSWQTAEDQTTSDCAGNTRQRPAGWSTSPLFPSFLLTPGWRHLKNAGDARFSAVFLINWGPDRAPGGTVNAGPPMHAVPRRRLVRNLLGLVGAGLVGSLVLAQGKSADSTMLA